MTSAGSPSGLTWVHESPPHWDGAKARIIGGAAPGTFDLGPYDEGDVIPGEWWRTERPGEGTVGYGWMDATWGDAEILLAVDPKQQGRGVGTFILDRLEDEAAARGLRYLHNVIADKHPDRARTAAWLERHGFEPEADGRLRRHVRAQRQG